MSPPSFSMCHRSTYSAFGLRKTNKVLYSLASEGTKYRKSRLTHSKYVYRDEEFGTSHESWHSADVEIMFLSNYLKKEI